ncbi:methyltransferase domain-containing protein [Candidatus Woesearchaeota archaeon]|nr:methyltransferase domain-containing protein [Candidatus Woesearchaeota archaeon]
MNEIRRVLITRQGRKFYAKDLNQDLHTQYGYIKKEDLKKAKDGDLLKSNTSKEFFIFSPSFIDLYKKIKRDAQIIPLKDIGVIIAETGINKESKVLDAGSGSGALACFLAAIAKEVVTYEIREDFIEIVKANIEFLGLKNVKVKHKDIYTEIDDKNIDVVILDLPEPWLALDNCAKALKPSGFLVSYSPSVPQVADFVNAVRKNGRFVYLKSVEITEREWEVEERRVRPKSKGLGHSGFLSFARKVT